MSHHTRRKLFTQLAKLINLAVIISMLVTMLPPTVYAAPPQQEPVVEQPIIEATPTPAQPASVNSTPSGDEIIYLPSIFKSGSGEPTPFPTPPAGSISTHVSPETGATLEYYGIQLIFPPKAVQETVVVTYTELITNQVKIAGRPFRLLDLTASTVDGKEVTHFFRPILFQFKYDEAYIDEQELIFLNWDENQNRWLATKATVDSTANILSADLAHFSLYALAGRDLSPELTWVEWRYLGGTTTEFKVRTISGASPQVLLSVSGQAMQVSAPGTNYDVNEFTFQVDTGPGSVGKTLSFNITAGTAYASYDGASGSFTVGSSGSQDEGIDIGERAANPPLYLAAWRADHGPEQRGKPKAVVENWNGFESQEFWGTPAGSYQARLIMNSRCGQPFFVRDGILETYKTTYNWLGGPLGHETTADGDNYPEWQGQPLSEFEHGFISKKPGEPDYRAHTYPPSIGNIYITPANVGGKAQLSFSAQVRLVPGFPNPSETAEVWAYWKGNDGKAHIRKMAPTGGENYSVTFDDAAYGDLINFGENIEFSITVNRSDSREGRFPGTGEKVVTIEAGALGPFGKLRPHPQDTTCEAFSTPPDNTPPTIEFVEIWPDGQGNLSVMAQVLDDRGVAGVSISGSPGQTDGSMQQIAGTAYGNGIYAGAFYKVPVNQIVNFTVEAVDTSGLRASKSGDSRVPFSAGYGDCAENCYEGNPVNTAIGNDTDIYTDLVVPGRGGTDIIINRAINSQNDRNGPFGRGTSFDYDTDLTFVYNRLLKGIQVRYGDGQTANFNDAGGGRYNPVSPGNFDYITQAGSDYVLHRKDRTTYQFNSKGQLVEIRNRNDRPLTLAYSGGKLSSIANDSGRQVTLAWNGDHIVQIDAPLKTLKYQYEGNVLRFFTNANRDTTEYQYDSAGRLIKIFTPKGHPRTQQEFDDRGRVKWQIIGEGERRDFSYDDSSRTTRVTDAYNRTIIYTYDDRYLVKSVTDARDHTAYYIHDARGNRTSYTDRRGYTWTYEYDDQGNQIKQIDPLDSSSGAIYSSDVTTWNYNEFNDLLDMTDALGQITRYKHDDHGNLIHVDLPDGATIDTTYNDYGQPFVVTDGEGRTTTNTYDPATGDLTALEDGEGHITRFGYDALGRQTSITDANGHTVRMVYDGNDNITNVTDARGHTTSFVYDKNNNLTDTYDRRNGYTHREYDASDRLKLLVDPEGSRTEYNYDLMGHSTVTKNPRGFTITYEYDPNYNVKTMQDETNRWWRYQYDENNNKTLVTDPQNHLTRYSYDALNRLKFLTDALDYTTEYCYDALDQLVRLFDPRRAETRFEYDPLGRLKRKINPLGETYEWVYDKAGNLKAETNGEGETTEYTYDKANRRVSASNPLHQAVTTTYDGVGNPVRVEDARHNPTEYGYDENNNLTVITNTLGYTVSFTYNEEDQRLSARDPDSSLTGFDYYLDGQLKTMTEPSGATTAYRYDPNKNLIELVNARDKATRYQYDPRDLLERIADPLDQITSHTYDEVGRKTATTDAENKTTAYHYDALGRLTGVTDALDQTTQYAYDPVGNTTAITYTNGTTTTFQYNFLDQVMMEADGLNHTWRYAYDEAGRLIRKTNGEWQVTHYRYDDAGRLSSTIFGETGRRVDFEYDANGNQVAMHDWNGTLRQDFNVLNRPITVTDYLSRTLLYTWNPDGSRAGLTYPDGRVLTYTYNIDNRLDQVTLPDGQTAGYEYDPLGCLAEVKYSNGVQAAYHYDDAGRLTGLHTSGPGGSVIAWYDYVLSKIGNRSEVTEQRLFSPAGPVETIQRLYHYDDLHRLVKATTVTSDTYELSWTLDGVGNWAERAGQVEPSLVDLAAPRPITTTYDHNPINALVRAGDWLYRYDGNGSRVGALVPLTATRYAALADTFGPGANLLITYHYDFENHLAGVEEGISYVVSGTLALSPTMTGVYTYDGLGRRVEKQVTAYISQTAFLTQPTVLQRQYLYDGLDPVVEYDDLDGAPMAVTYYYHGNDRLVAQAREPISDTAVLHWYSYDGLGSVIALTDNNGVLTTTYRYNEYGELLAGDTTENRYTYTEQEWDEETAFYHFFARPYDAQNGVWLIQDAYRGSSLDPLSLARYAFVTNNPVNLYDPLGNWGLKDAWNGVKKAAGDAVNKATEFVKENPAIVNIGLTVAAGIGTAVLCAAVPVVGCLLGAAAIGAVQSYGTQIVDNIATKNLTGWDALTKNIDLGKIATDTAVSVAGAGIGLGSAGLTSKLVSVCKTALCPVLVNTAMGVGEGVVTQYTSNVLDNFGLYIDRDPCNNPKSISDVFKDTSGVITSGAFGGILNTLTAAVSTKNKKWADYTHKKPEPLPYERWSNSNSFTKNYGNGPEKLKAVLSGILIPGHQDLINNIPEAVNEVSN